MKVIQNDSISPIASTSNDKTFHSSDKLSLQDNRASEKNSLSTTQLSKEELPVTGTIELKKIGLSSPDHRSKRKEISGGSEAFFNDGNVITQNLTKKQKQEPSPTKTTEPSQVKSSPLKTKAATPIKSKPIQTSPLKKRVATPIKSNDTNGNKSNSKSSIAVEVTNRKLVLDNQKVVVTGVFQSMSREEVEDLVKQHGGKVSSAVSGKTDFLVAGERLEDGRPAFEGGKYRSALEKKVLILSEDDLLAKIGTNLTTNDTPSLLHTSLPPNSSPRDASLLPDSDKDDLWVDKHKPKHSSEMIGSAELVKKMGDWLRRWDGQHLHKTGAKIPYSKENPGAKAALLSGPPGIGKTTVATLIANEFGYDLLELNASDTRNKKELDHQLLDAVQSRSISISGDCSLKKRVEYLLPLYYHVDMMMCSAGNYGRSRRHGRVG